MDRMVCFNIGRTSTVSDEHIDCSFPEATFDRSARPSSIALAIHNVRLRQIQSWLTHDVYAIAKPNLTANSQEKRQAIVEDLQMKLEEWRRELHSIYNKNDCPHSLAFVSLSQCPRSI